MKYLLVAIGVPACLGMAWYVYDDAASDSKSAKKKKAEATVAVHATTLQTRPMRETVQLAGRIEPRAQATLRARVAGYVAKLPYDLGDKVESNKPVVKLDDTRMKQAVETAQAAVKVAKAQVAVAKKERKPAEDTLAKYKVALQQGAITQQQVDEAEAQLDILKTREALAAENLNSAQTDLKIQQETLKETEIVSRFPGVVAQRFVEVGDLANPNDPLLRIVDLTTVLLEVTVVEANYGKVKVGQTANIRVDAHRDTLFVGKVIRKSPELDRETRTGLVKIAIDNKKNELRPGMTARAEIIIRDRPDANALPLAALLDHGDERFVYVIAGKPARAKRRDVKIGIIDRRFVEILEGLRPDDRIITLGNRLLSPGQLVDAADDPNFPSKSKADTPSKSSEQETSKSTAG